MPKAVLFAAKPKGLDAPKQKAPDLGKSLPGMFNMHCQNRTLPPCLGDGEDEDILRPVKLDDKSAMASTGMLRVPEKLHGALV